MLVKVKKFWGDVWGFIIIGDEKREWVNDDKAKIVDLIRAGFEIFNAQICGRGDFVYISVGGFKAWADVVDEVFFGGDD